MSELLLFLILGVSIAALVLLALQLLREKAAARDAREELGRMSHNLITQLSSNAGTQNAQFETLRASVEQRLERIQQDNATKLEQMRQTVDEKLHATLEQRLSESFKVVSERLELVHKGLGEMQALATGVGDLKRVLTNVKTRGTWGEIQLGALLEQLLVPEQYAKNVATRPGSRDRVEFAIRLPGREGQEQVWLPIDSKFPTEDYERLVLAQERADPAALE